MPARRFSRSILLAACLFVAGGALLAGCGQKGPLYLPVEEGEERNEQETPKADKAGPSDDT